jgi:hypothetical protein
VYSNIEIVVQQWKYVDICHDTNRRVDFGQFFNCNDSGSERSFRSSVLGRDFYPHQLGISTNLKSGVKRTYALIEESFNQCWIKFFFFILRVRIIFIDTLTISTTFGATASVAHRATRQSDELVIGKMYGETYHSPASFLHPR